MRYFTLVLLCLMAFLLTACSDKAQQRQRENERAIADLQVSATDMDQRLADLDQRVAAASNELSVLKNHPYPVKTTKGSKTNYIASAPSMPTPPPPLIPANSSGRGGDPLLASGAMPIAQQPNDGWLPSFAAPPPPSARGTGAKPVSAPAAQSPKAQSPQDQSKRPAGLNDLALPSETPIAAPQQAALSSPPPASRGGRQASAPPSASGQSEEALYNKALAEFNSGRHAQAATGFTELMYAYPSGRFAPNAGYWLGESLYGQNQFNDALAQFKEVTSRFPQHHKAPDAMFKAGLCYMRLGDRENAATQFRALTTDYPNSPAANLARQRGFVR
jgi:tol-pal system protein YbgF